MLKECFDLLVLLPRLILSIFLSNPALVQLSLCSNLSHHIFKAPLSSIFCLPCLLSLLAASVLLSLPQYLCLSVYQFWCVICLPHFDMCSGVNFSKPCLVDHFHSPNHLKLEILCFSFGSFLLLPASFCCCLLLLSAAACSLHWVRSTETGMLSQRAGVRGQGPGYALTLINWSVVLWHDTLVSCHQCHRSA